MLKIQNKAPIKAIHGSIVFLFELEKETRLSLIKEKENLLC